MTLPLKDIPQFGLQPHFHRAFARIAKSRHITMSSLGREIIEAYVAKEIHDAKVVLGIDVDNPDQAELDLAGEEPHRAAPRGTKR